MSAYEYQIWIKLLTGFAVTKGFCVSSPLKRCLINWFYMVNQVLNCPISAMMLPSSPGKMVSYSLAADGIMTRLLVSEPYAAGKAAVMVAVNDIYSMGGRPLAMVNVLASGDEDHRSKVVEGIKKGCEKLRVPMVGGHLHPDAPGEFSFFGCSHFGSMPTNC